MENKVKIKVKSWSHTCDDGCCYTWGTDIYVNGEKVSDGEYDSIEGIIKDVLKRFGVEVEIDLEIED